MKKITLITGAGRGIGFEVAKLFASKNENLILTVRKKCQIKEVNKIKKMYDSNIRVFVGDLNNLNFIKKIGNQVKLVNTIVNNASGENQKYFTEVTEKDLNNMINVNLVANFMLTKIFVKKMIKKKIKGNVINLGSQLGHMGAHNRSIYCMVKFGIEGLTKSLAMDLGKHGIRVNSVSPTKTIVNSSENKSSKRLNLIKKKIPLGKFSTTQEIANIVYFLTTSSAASITGTSIISDGGWTAGK
jgi:NAD(P)-dependent dehydrogenase (short-subunit alcohol dehydrogenase family)